MSEIKILIIEDEPLIAADIAQCLTNLDFCVSGIAYNTSDALQELETNLPDAILLDINLHEERDGIDLAGVINAKYKLPFVFLTSHADRLTLERAIKTIPAGYIVKPFDEKDVLVNLEIALHNHAQQHNAAYPILSLKAINRHLVKPMSEREFEILNAIYDGKTNQQMAEAFYLSVNTIKTHIANIYGKLEVTSRTAAIAKLRNWL